MEETYELRHHSTVIARVQSPVSPAMTFWMKVVERYLQEICDSIGLFRGPDAVHRPRMFVHLDFD